MIPNKEQQSSDIVTLINVLPQKILKIALKLKIKKRQTLR